MSNVELYCGDCLELMKKIPNSRLLLTDIPYEKVNQSNNGLRVIGKGKANNKTFDIDCFLNTIYHKADILIIFCGNEQYSQIYSFFSNKSANKEGTVRQIVWCKSNPSPMNGEYVYLNACENAVWFKKRRVGKLNGRCKKSWFVAPTGSSKYHPTEKNHKLLTELISDNTNEGDTIIDCCMGSGSTGIVATQLNRNFIGIELDKEYFEIAKKRIEEAQNERTL